MKETLATAWLAQATLIVVLEIYYSKLLIHQAMLGL